MSVCLSVCHTPVFCQIQPCTILVFRTTRYGNIPTWSPYRGRRIQGVEKLRFSTKYLALLRKRYEIKPQLLWKTNRKPYPSFIMVRFWLTLSDLLVKHSMTRSIARSICDSWASCTKALYILIVRLMSPEEGVSPVTKFHNGRILIYIRSIADE